MTAVWQTLSALMMCAATTGLSYTFGTYSKALKAQFGLSQGQLETISVACFSCGFVTWLPGMLGDHLGPRLSVMLGGFVMSCSFGSFWAFATMRIALPSGGLLETDWAVLTLCFFSVMQYLGSAMVTGAVFTAGVRNFPTQRGLLTGLVKGWVGLCGGMTTQIFIGLVTIKDLGDLTDPAWLDFCMVASAVCLAATLVPSLFIKLHDTSEYPAFAQNVQRRVMLGYLVLLVMGTTVVSSALLEKVVDHVVVLALAIAIIIIWMSAALLALPCLDVNLSSSRVYDPLATSEDAAESEASTGLLFAVSPELGSISTTEPRASVIHEQDVNMSLVQMVQTLNFWLLLWSCMALIGAGIAVTTNNAQARPCIQAVTVASAVRVHVCACTGWSSLHKRPLVGMHACASWRCPQSWRHWTHHCLRARVWQPTIGSFCTDVCVDRLFRQRCGHDIFLCSAVRIQSPKWAALRCAKETCVPSNGHRQCFHRSHGACVRAVRLEHGCQPFCWRRGRCRRIWCGLACDGRSRERAFWPSAPRRELYVV